MAGEEQSGNSRSETARRIAIGVAWGLAPVLFVAWYAVNVEGPMGAGARVLGITERLMLVALASAVVGVAGLFGMRALRFCRIAPESLLARFVLGVGLGLGVMSLATLGLGCAGFARAPAAAALLAAMFLAGISELRAVGDYLRRTDRPRERLSVLELGLVLAMLLALAFQLILAFNLPVDYDACEYHMAAPWRWAQLGRIDWVEGNVYTNLPMNAEMLYLFGMELVGGGPGAAWDRLCLGVHLGVLLNMMTALAATGAVYVLARRFWSRRAALVASALFATMPWTTIATTVNIHNEILLAAWATLAVYALLEFRETRLVRWAILSAVFAGLAGGVKYTALAFFVPVGAAAVIVMVRGAAWHKRIATALLYAAAVLVVMGPWFAKNLAFTGNPVFPFAYKWFGGRDWSPELDWKWYAGNYKAAGADKAGNLLVATWDRVIWPGHHHGSAAIALFSLLALAAWRDKTMRWLWALLALWTLLWYFGTHRVDRFWLPFAGVAAALAGCGFESLRAKSARVALTALLFVGLAWQLAVSGLVFSAHAAGNYDVVTRNEVHLVKRYDLAVLVNELSYHPLEGCVLLVGEAKTLYLPPTVISSTVFNAEALTKIVGRLDDPWWVKQKLQEGNVERVFVNWREYGRLWATYTLTGPDGRVLPGLPRMTPRAFLALELQRYPGAGHVLWSTFPKAPDSLPGLTKAEVESLPDHRVMWVYDVPPLKD